MVRIFGRSRFCFILWERSHLLFSFRKFVTLRSSLYVGLKSDYVSSGYLINSDLVSFSVHICRVRKMKDTIGKLSDSEVS